MPEPPARRARGPASGRNEPQSWSGKQIGFGRIGWNMSADFAERRVKMVDGQIRTTDVTSAPLLDAMLVVPREAFVGPGQRDLAYIDEDIRIANGADGPRYLMEPSPLAKLMQLAEIGPGDSALDVGCGTGYASAILSRLAKSVVALESDPALTETAMSTLSALGCDNVAVVEGPLPEGYARQGTLRRHLYRRQRGESAGAAARPACRRRPSRRRRRAGEFGDGPIVF